MLQNTVIVLISFIVRVFKQLSFIMAYLERTYKVTYACDYLDPNPTVKTFDDFDEMQDWLTEEVQSRLDFYVQHSPYTVSEDDLKSQEEIEYSLVRIEEV